MVIDINKFNMKYRMIILFISLVLLISGCIAEQEMLEKKYRPSRNVPQPDAFRDPWGSYDKSNGLIYKRDNRIGSHH